MKIRIRLSLLCRDGSGMICKSVLNKLENKVKKDAVEASKDLVFAMLNDS